MVVRTDRFVVMVGLAGEMQTKDNSLFSHLSQIPIYGTHGYIGHLFLGFPIQLFSGGVVLCLLQQSADDLLLFGHFLTSLGIILISVLIIQDEIYSVKGFLQFF